MRTEYKYMEYKGVPYVIGYANGKWFAEVSSILYNGWEAGKTYDRQADAQADAEKQIDEQL